jgi:uncharacterized Zn-finger protein
MEESKFKCDFVNCSKMYSNSYNLKRHVQSFHQGIKKFSCESCHKRLSSKQNLREHKFIHLDVKPYVCNYKGCKQAYRQISQLTLHQNIHIAVQKHLSPVKPNFDRDLGLLAYQITKESNKKVVEYQAIPCITPIIVLPEIKFKYS